jgi:hypothetical protein
VETRFSEIGKNSGKLSKESLFPLKQRKNRLWHFPRQLLFFLGKKINLPSRENAGGGEAEQQ